MPRCGCANDRCSCFIQQGPNVTITGSGTQNDPYVVEAATVVLDSEGQPLPEVTDQAFIGQVITYAGPSAPSADYVPCDGRELSRAVYTTLFARLGTFYGAGDGSTTFNVPNTGGRFVMGADGSNVRGSTGGASTRALSEANLPAHAHTMNHSHGSTGNDGTHDHQIQRSASTGGNNANVPEGTGVTDATSRAAILDDGAHTHTIPAYTGSTGLGGGTATPFSTVPPYVALPQYIRVQGGP